MRTWWLMALAGCGGGGFNSGLPSGKLVSELSGEEVCEMATALDEYSTRLFDAETVCYVNARIGAQSGPAGEFTTTCEQFFQACMDAGDGEESPFDFGDCDPADANDVPAGCVATVGDYEACFGDALNGFVDYARLRCESPEVEPPQLFDEPSCAPIEACST